MTCDLQSLISPARHVWQWCMQRFHLLGQGQHFLECQCYQKHHHNWRYHHLNIAGNMHELKSLHLISSFKCKHHNHHQTSDKILTIKSLPWHHDHYSNPRFHKITQTLLHFHRKWPSKGLKKFQLWVWLKWKGQIKVRIENIAKNGTLMLSPTMIYAGTKFHYILN